MTTKNTLPVFTEQDIDEINAGAHALTETDIKGVSGACFSPQPMPFPPHWDPWNPCNPWNPIRYW